MTEPLLRALETELSYFQKGQGAWKPLHRKLVNFGKSCSLSGLLLAGTEIQQDQLNFPLAPRCPRDCGMMGLLELLKLK